jgi:hypothetical protein
MSLFMHTKWQIRLVYFQAFTGAECDTLFVNSGTLAGKERKTFHMAGEPSAAVMVGWRQTKVAGGTDHPRWVFTRSFSNRAKRQFQARGNDLLRPKFKSSVSDKSEAERFPG